MWGGQGGRGNMEVMQALQAQGSCVGEGRGDGATCPSTRGAMVVVCV